MATIEVDGKSLEVEDGSMVIEATDAAGIYIPRFCYHEKLSIAANCRMCLVEVEKAPKPLPACATPVMDGMVVKTRSKLAREAQKGTMEFLLINHPLDCPVCDQGGECPLQDQALGYGKDDSRFYERKRVVPSFDIGPLIATEMTRCIHCTRCVRYGEEVAGVMEMGAPGRGEFTRIGTFLNQSIDSEVSGNMIDLCPVGALTSKPFRFSARSWELQSQRSISPHDTVGANINIQTLRKEVERVLPADNDEVNDCWLADRDRYSYEALNGETRLTVPMIRDDSGWRETDWETALKHAAAGIRTALSGDGNEFGALAGYSASLEEFHLTKKLATALGSGHADFRSQQVDFRDDPICGLPVSEMPIADYDQLSAALLVGSNVRKEQPLLSIRLRTAVVKNQAAVSCINVMDYPMNFDLLESQTTSHSDLVTAVASIAKTVALKTDKTLPDSIDALAGRQIFESTAEKLLSAEGNALVLVGANAQQHPDASVIKAICEWISEACDARLAVLAPGNAVAGYLAGCLPSTSGLNSQSMLTNPRKAYLLVHTDPELDNIDGKVALNAMQAAHFVVQVSPFKNNLAMQYADVLLPAAGFAEASGTYVNCNAKQQAAQAAAPSKNDARPGWKILRVLGNFLELEGFDYVSLEDVTQAVSIKEAACSPRMREWQMMEPVSSSHSGLFRIADMPMYRGDITVRHAPALQITADNPRPAARLNRNTADDLQFDEGMSVKVKNCSGEVALPVAFDDRVPEGAVYVPAGFVETAMLGGQVPVTLEPE
ncbi:MAG: NADH-quinone oxidoreductase subunit NuoG [Pseudomonadota bacterium]